jgi:hypothetical protein
MINICPSEVNNEVHGGAAAKFVWIYNTPYLYGFYINAEEKWYLPYIWTMMHSVSFPSHNRKTEDLHV